MYADKREYFQGVILSFMAGMVLMGTIWRYWPVADIPVEAKIVLSKAIEDRISETSMELAKIRDAIDKLSVRVVCEVKTPPVEGPKLPPLSHKPQCR